MCRMLSVTAWLTLIEAASFIATLQKRQGLTVACPEEIAYYRGWIDTKQLNRLAAPLEKNGYGKYLKRILSEQLIWSST